MKAKEKKQKKGKVRNQRIPDADGVPLSNPLRSRARTHEGLTGRERMIRRWLDAVFANGVQDPVPAVVDEAMAALNGNRSFRRAWIWYANRLGVNTTLDLLYTVKSEWEQGELRDPARAFHSRMRKMCSSLFGRVKSLPQDSQP